jgi:hypothetical protein
LKLPKHNSPFSFLLFCLYYQPEVLSSVSIQNIRFCQQVYGRVDNGYSGILDPGRLVRVYALYGDTKRCQRIAVKRAKKHYLLQERRGDDHEDDPSDDDYSYGGQNDATNHRHQYHDDQDSSKTDIGNPRTILYLKHSLHQS